MSRRFTIVVDTVEPERVAEALRAALGLSLRGDRVEVVIAESARAATDPRIDRAIATLRELGHPVSSGDRLVDAVRHADAVQVWT